MARLLLSEVELDWTGNEVWQCLGPRILFRSTHAIPSSRNSEVIHAGIYYPLNSLKSQYCVRGRELLYDRCERLGIGYKKTGKVSPGFCLFHYVAFQSFTLDAVDPCYVERPNTIPRRTPCGIATSHPPITNTFTHDRSRRPHVFPRTKRGG